MTNFDRHTLIGHIDNAPAWLLTSFRDGDLHMEAVVAPQGPTEDTERASAECGQCAYSFTRPNFVPAAGINIEKILRVWDRWHLNNLRPECSHQRTDWDLKGSIGEDIEGWCGKRSTDGFPSAASVRASEHPRGLLGKPCATCGHRLGRSFIHEEVHAHVLRYLRRLPNDVEKGGKDALPKAWRIIPEPPKVWVCTRDGQLEYNSRSDDAPGQTDCMRYIHDTVGKSVAGAARDGVLIQRVEVRRGRMVA